MMLPSRIIYLCFARGYCFKNITTSKLVGSIKTLKSSVPTLKLQILMWKPQKSVLLTKFYQGMFQRGLKASKHGVLLGMAFFSPSIFFVEDQPIKIETKDEEPPPFIAEDPYKKLLDNANPWKVLLFRIYEAICTALRSVKLFFTFFPIFIVYPITYFGTYPNELWWKLLLAGIEISGPIFIKFGQWASTRRDLFPEECCNNFSRLQRRTKPHSWHYTKTQLTKIFGKDWRKTFVKFDNDGNPVGSGCIAQVYKVWMNEEHIKDKDILQEIIQEQDDLEHNQIGFFQDALEIWGVRKWFDHTKHEEEAKAIAEYRESKQADKEERDYPESHVVTQDIKVITEELADEILLLSLKPNHEIKSYGESGREVSEWGESELDEHHCETQDHHNHQHSEEDHLEHALVEQWQSSLETMEKSLPASEEHPINLDGLVPVALKILHPRVYRTFRRDMTIFRYCAWFVTLVCPPIKWLALEKCMDEFFEVMTAQVDLRREADNLEAFIHTFAEVETVRFPRPVRPFVTRRVLVETYEEGEPIIHFIGDEKPEPTKKNLAKIGVDTLLKMIFTDNFIHGDLHPGNILVQNENSSSPEHDGNTSKYMMVDIGGDTFVMNVVEDPNPLRLCILDCGIVAKLKPRDANNFRSVFKEVIHGNGRKVADLFLDNSDHQCDDPETFRNDMSELVRTARRGAVTLEQVDIGLLLQQVLGLLLKHRIRLESAFSSVVLAVFVLEGLGRSLDPEMDILERARPLLL